MTNESEAITGILPECPMKIKLTEIQYINTSNGPVKMFSNWRLRIPAFYGMKYTLSVPLLFTGTVLGNS